MRAAAPEYAKLLATPVRGAELMQAHFVRHSFDRHSHETWSIGVTYGGLQTFRCRGRKSTSQAGNIIVFRPDDAHDGHGEDETGFRYAMFYLREDLVAQWLREAGLHRATQGFQQALIEDQALAQRLAGAVQACSQKRESLRAATALQSVTLAVFRRHGGAPDAASAAERGAPWLGRVQEYLDAHFANDVGVNELAGLAGVSRVHLTRTFTAATGLAPHAYLNARRLRHARELLAAGQTIAQTAIESGFADQSHLTRRFKGTYGVTPGAWTSERTSASPVGAARRP
jgi:AraC-like DNA-binding protein